MLRVGCRRIGGAFTAQSHHALLRKSEWSAVGHVGCEGCVIEDSSIAMVVSDGCNVTKKCDEEMQVCWKKKTGAT